MTQKIRQVRQHAKKHQKAHLHLKTVLGRTLKREKILGLFVGTFVIVLATILIFFNWEKIIHFFEASKVREAAEENIEEPFIQEEEALEGYQTSMLTNYLINGQVAYEYINSTQTTNTGEIPSENDTKPNAGSSTLGSVELNYILGHDTQETNETSIGISQQTSLVINYYIGQGQLNDPILANDLELLSKIRNTLEVDLFAYLNQSNSRADSLDDFLFLLNTLKNQGQEQLSDLTSKINSLSNTFENQESNIDTKEENFFELMSSFNAIEAGDALINFIEIQKDQVETRAKIGAYQTLKDYYDYYLPNIDLLIQTINANRDPLIAGVRVVEIEDMQLELIIRE